MRHSRKVVCKKIRKLHNKIYIRIQFNFAVLFFSEIHIIPFYSSTAL